MTSKNVRSKYSVVASVTQQSRQMSSTVSDRVQRTPEPPLEELI